MTNRFLILLFLLMGISLSAPASAESSATPGSGVTNVADATVQKEAPKSTDVVSFKKICGEKSKDRGRLRYCGEYFEKYLGVKADPILYLRERITGLKENAEKFAEKNRFWHIMSVYVLLGISAVVLVVLCWQVFIQKSFSSVSSWIATFGAVSVVLVAFVAAFGWLGKYRAEYSVYVELSALRDRIEVEASYYITHNKDISDETVKSWTSEFAKISERFARSYGNASALPDLAKLSPN